jgi:uncharacterized protein
MCVSANIYAEYEEVIRRPRLRFSEQVIANTLGSIREVGFWVRPVTSVRACLDPDDDIFLECAQEVQAASLVTGNRRHFPDSWGSTRVVAARWLLDRLLDDGNPVVS